MCAVDEDLRVKLCVVLGLDYEMAGGQEILTTVETIATVAAYCSCGTTPMNYEGPAPDCPVHGAVRALNELTREAERLRSGLRDALGLRDPPVSDADLIATARRCKQGYDRARASVRPISAEFRPGDRVEWNPTGDEWKPGTVHQVGGVGVLIRLDENGQTLLAQPEHLRPAEPPELRERIALAVTDRIWEPDDGVDAIADAVLPVVAPIQADRDRLAAELAELHTWRGLMALLDEHWPADVFDGSPDSRDPGPRIVALMRQVDLLRRELEKVRDGGRVEMAEPPSLMDAVREVRAALDRRREQLARDLAHTPDPALKMRIAELVAHREQCCASESDCDAWRELTDLRWVLARRAESAGVS